MDSPEQNNAEIEDLTVIEDTSFEVKGGEGAGGECNINSFNIMKKVDKA